ncbi:LacI family DNA-binding transcriptional regulator [Paenibacillus eucommiae]|uniref:LacI family transcriptional regulator n=1 Tax=Paenibacillus eucommiae TaxID=1355755 RepID=A0ABS4ITE9_9BACL|nr:LacI family DNA-binding transcriptional regulator [Paenibacillus eucommiae]MBP1990848.1 LacI family transcriptional regulator [Paenibacillus eucommiae]
MKKRITIHDIAKMAGVSSATVSRVLGNSTYPVSAKLRDKIVKLAEEMHYIPNMIGKQLKTNNNMTIGVIIPTISNPFYASVMLGIEEVARKKGYHVLLGNSLQDGKIEEAYLTTLFEKQVKGFIISSISDNKKLLMNLIDLGLQVIAIDQKIDLPEVQQIEFDYRRGGFIATSHLLEQGHRRIAYVSAPLNRPSRQSIYEGFLDAMQQAGAQDDEVLVQIANEEKEIYDGIYEFENGKALTANLMDLDQPPTAIFACNDLTAFGVMNELVARGLKVPDDVSVVGFDNIEYARMFTPALTTVKQPNYEMGKLACTMLLDKLNDEAGDSMDVLLQPKLIVRDSVGKL